MSYLYLIVKKRESIFESPVEVYDDEAKADERKDLLIGGGVFLKKLTVQVIREEE